MVVVFPEPFRVPTVCQRQVHDTVVLATHICKREADVVAVDSVRERFQKLGPQFGRKSRIVDALDEPEERVLGIHGPVLLQKGQQSSGFERKNPEKSGRARIETAEIEAHRV